jgi:hypothetical protein
VLRLVVMVVTVIATAIPPSALDPKWTTDANGNQAPDFVEVGLGLSVAGGDSCVAKACPGGKAAGEIAPTRTNLLFIVDASGSMAARAGRETKMDAARRTLVAQAGRLPADVSAGLMVYGHKGDNTEAGKAASCGAADVLAPLGGFDAAGAQQAAAGMRAVGWTPIALAVRTARQAFTGHERDNNHIVLISDGLETCGGNAVSEVNALKSAGLTFRLDVVGFDIARGEDAELRRIASAGGGEYFGARDGDALSRYFEEQLGTLIARRDALFDAAVCGAAAVSAYSKCLTDITSALSTAKRIEYTAASPAGRTELDTIMERWQRHAEQLRQTTLKALNDQRDAAASETRKQSEKVSGAQRGRPRRTP